MMLIDQIKNLAEIDLADLLVEVNNHLIDTHRFHLVSQCFDLKAIIDEHVVDAVEDVENEKLLLEMDIHQKDQTIIKLEKMVEDMQLKQKS